MISTLTLLSSLLIVPWLEFRTGEDPTTALPADGSRIVVIGDSITQSGEYVVYLEAFLRTRFPDRSFTIINHGLSSETASGLSEPDHPGRRPWIHDRFDRDVTDWEPDVVLACYGMNDGIYHPFDPERFRSYQEGIRRLIDRVREDSGAKLVLLTPPPYDPYRRQVGDPDAEDFGYRFPAADYDRLLERYAEWLQSLADDDLRVIDVNTEFSAHVDDRRNDLASFSVTPDGVHPDPTGHWLIAQAILRAWQVPGVVAEAHVIANEARAESEEIDQVTFEEDTLSFSWRSPLPMALDPRWDLESIKRDEVADRLNRYRLKVEGLAPGMYRLLAAERGRDFVPLGDIPADTLAEGLDLSNFPAFPTVQRANLVLETLLSTRSSQAGAWRDSIRNGEPPTVPPPGEDEAIEDPFRSMCQPMDLLIRIEPAR